MTDGTTKEQALAAIRAEIAAKRAAAETEDDDAKRERLLRHAQLREEIADEEAEAIAADAADNQQAALSLRVPASLVAELKARAEAEHIPTSALVRRLLTQAMREPTAPVLTVEQVEQIARRVYRESA
ncbi:ribbon-helix-helix protein, CopG family [Kibdelosporangium philippinense]|uniref:Ribbon-helix-helix protein, CopG family n=1 Tax=Kibdelosporangium philippinense TaxID=211113 RepID=A0ABS8ZMK4_9PSEU|nr:ribbon-helix-helix protein, CopG family [Kibdelosporangium philippinense]MCE7007683.1 ribbon-helix-helix protein, CopG family [Kibdelosporangium philippinense]